MPARKIHYSYVGPGLTIPVCCDRTALWKGTQPDRKPLTSTDPRHVTCRDCQRAVEGWLSWVLQHAEDASHARTQGPFLLGICLRWDSWNMTAVTSKMHGMPVTGGRGFRALKPL
jgi:hypothetical protein